MTDKPGEWQQRMINRLLKLGYTGFRFERGQWYPTRGEIGPQVGPFSTTDEFDAWLDKQEIAQTHAKYLDEASRLPGGLRGR